jgi:aminoglycoside phosphotransferase (APT) family kinase protein
VIDAAAARDFLNAQWRPDVADVELIGAGDWSRAFGFTSADQRLVARFGKHREDFEADLQAMPWAGPELPVPEVLEILETQDGGFCAISRRAEGVFLEQLDADAARRIAGPLCAALDAMRAIGPSSDPGYTWPQWVLGTLVDVPDSRVGGWRELLARDPALDALFERGLSELRDAVPELPDQHTLIHRDMLNRNVLAAPDGSRLTAVFDWGCSTFGDWVYEVAWFGFWAPWHEAVTEIDLPARLLTAEHHVRYHAYLVQIGLEHLAYCAWASGREAQLREVADRLRVVLDDEIKLGVVR